jgi:hypothetical protein
MKEIKFKNMNNEKDVKTNIRKVFDSIGEELWYFMPPANGYGRSGIPDFLGCYKGMFFGVEAKYGYNTPSNNQIREINNIKYAQGQCWIVNDANLKDWEAEFRGWVAVCS